MISSKHQKTDTIKMLIREIGGLLIVLGFTMVVPLLVSLFYREYYTVAGFALALLITTFLGFLLNKGLKSPVDLLKRHALMIAALGWLSVAVMGALPYFLTALITPLSASAQGTVGLSCGITVPSMSPVLETIYIFQMWLGRLEVIPVLVLIRAVLFGSAPSID